MEGEEREKVLPLSPAKGESDYEVKRSFKLVAFSTASLVGESRLSRIWIHARGGGGGGVVSVMLSSTEDQTCKSVKEA